MRDPAAPGGPAVDHASASALRLLRIVAVVSTMDRFAMPPMLLTIAADLGVQVPAVASAAGAYYLAYGAMQPVWGVVSDRIGTVRTIRITLLVGALATGLAAASPGPVWLTVTRALAGAGFGAAIPGSLVYIGDTVRADRRQRHVTDLMSGVALGTAVAAGGAGVLAGAASWRWAFVVTGVTTVALLPPLARTAPRSRPARTAVLGPMRRVLTDRTALLVLAAAFTEGAVILGGVLTFLPAALESSGASPSLAGGVTAVFGLTVLATAPLAGWLSARLHPAWLTGVGAVALSAACGVVSAELGPVSALAGCVLLGVAWAFLHSTLQTWATEVTPEARAMAVSLFAGLLFAGSAAASALGGSLAGRGRYPTLFLAALVTSLPLGAATVAGRMRWRPADRA